MPTPSSAHPIESFERAAAEAERRGLRDIRRDRTDGTPVLKVSGATFARLHEPGILAIACPHQQKAMLMEISPAVYFDLPGYEDEQVLFIRLREIDDEELSLRLHDAWHFRAPEALRSANALKPGA